MHELISTIQVLTALIGAFATFFAVLHKSHHEDYADKFKTLEKERDNLAEDYENERKKRKELEAKYEKLKKKLENTE